VMGCYFLRMHFFVLKLHALSWDCRSFAMLVFWKDVIKDTLLEMKVLIVKALMLNNRIGAWGLWLYACQDSGLTACGYHTEHHQPMISI
jgi:hypothetical protein